MGRHASLNRIYRLVWNAARGCWIAVAECARGRGKSRTVLAASLMAAPLSLVLAATPPPTQLPTNGQVVAGQASLSTSGARLDVNQSSQRAVIDWQTFNIGANAQVNFNQPGASSVALNRVLTIVRVPGDANDDAKRIVVELLHVGPNQQCVGDSKRADLWVPAELVNRNGFNYALPKPLQEAARSATPTAAACNGEALPTWLRFEPRSRRFIATLVPEGALPFEATVHIGNQTANLLVKEQGD